jgi:hypothetical protein
MVNATLHTCNLSRTVTTNHFADRPDPALCSEIGLSRLSGCLRGQPRGHRCAQLSQFLISCAQSWRRTSIDR